VFAYDENNLATELTAATADITWTVELSNPKAAAFLYRDDFAEITRRNAGESDRNKLVIKPGPRTLTGPNQIASFNNGTITFGGTTATIPLGEARTDPEAHLLVLGGFGTSMSPTGSGLVGDTFNHDQWCDDVADGPVKATVKIKATNQTFDAVGAWIIVAPPKFAPAAVNPITLFDRLFDFFVQSGMAAAPAQPSFRRDIAPILQAALDAKGIVQSASLAHASIDPAQFPISSAPARLAIFNKLKTPAGGGGNMPLINSNPSLGDGHLTQTQFQNMQRWKDGNFNNDWPPPAVIPITPDELDRAALFHCVGAALFPGIRESVAAR
jgi:hypothetical protein